MSTEPIAFLFDERLPHDRKITFTRLIHVLKSKFQIDILPSRITEQELISHLDTHQYKLILLPWYHYIAWKKLESYFGAMRMHGSTIAGYFADAVLPFEFSGVPSHIRFLFIDFYRMKQNEIELILSELTGDPIKKPKVFYSVEWNEDEGLQTKCVDALFKTQVLKNPAWSTRLQSLRFCFTALWMLCFNKKQNTKVCFTPKIELFESNQCLIFKIIFESTELNLKQMIEYLWPTGNRNNQAINELLRHSDFVKIHHYPESNLVEFTVIMTESAPALEYPGEVRGFIVEPFKMKYLPKK